ncbi:MAG: transporter [Chloroflexi bacterium]|nr:transporter [Chloroflexota bacterium]MCI0577366.1 transporter [Chloroflexota bacterium]MCI0647053.1 transporter [Chloroflexota bacterium]MCI0731540.1 transporter [Chloroflexota bacterium]
MIDLLIANPLLLLFLVSAVGYAIGRIKVKGSSLGVAAVLFVGLAAGALHPDLALPEIIFLLGLVVFVYTVGLSSGPGFFASFRRKGLRDNLFVVGMITFAALLSGGAHFLLGLKATVTAGLFAGSLTNTPALAGLLDLINSTAPAAQRDALLAEPVVGYSVAYPMGVLGVILAVFVTQRLWRIDYPAEARRLRKFHVVEQELYNRTVRVTRPEVTGVPLRELRHHQWDVLFSRLKRGEEVSLARAQTTLQPGDLINLVGTPEAVDALIPQLGEPAGQDLEWDRSEYDYRRVFVSNPAIAGRRLAELHLPRQYGAVVTRVRRGDIDLLAEGDTVLELGDRVRVVARREALPALSRLFGDSYRDLSELNLVSFGLGLTAGLLLGLVPIPLPGGVTFRLGFAGGPLIVALVLGALRRTGRLVWTLPYSANLTLRQVGLTLLLAGISVRSGYTFFSTFSQSGGLAIFLAGAAVTWATAVLTLWLGYKTLHIPFALLAGMLSALQTQPAVLGYALEQADNDLPNIGYALIFLMATMTKILFAQLLLTLLQ